MDVAIANIGRSAKRSQQSESLGTTPLVAANILPPAIREFRKQRPDVRIQLFDADLPTLIQMVETGKLDMSLPTRWRDTDLAFPGPPAPTTHRQAARASRCEGADRVHGQPARRADCAGRSRRRDRHHSLIRGARVPQPKGGDEPVDQSGVRIDFRMISRRGREPPPGAVELTTSFLKSHIALLAGRAGVL